MYVCLVLKKDDNLREIKKIHKNNKTYTQHKKIFFVIK